MSAKAGKTPTIYLFCGLTASGKSALASRWSTRRGLSYANSDVLRKELASPQSLLQKQVSSPEAVDQGIYSPEFTRRTYDRLLEVAENELAAGRSVVLDASYLAAAERTRVLALAAGFKAECRFIFCDCSDKVRKERLALRAKDPQAVSDGRWEIYLAQKKKLEPPLELDKNQLIELNTESELEQLLCRLDAILR